MAVPFFRPSITDAEIGEVVDTLKSGWLTTGPKTKRFEVDFAKKVERKHAIALNSCTAALHLALEAIGFQRGDIAIVPTMTFAATAEVVRYFDGVPVFVDVDPVTLTMDPRTLDDTLTKLARGQAVPGLARVEGKVKAILPVHYGGQMADVFAIEKLARAHGAKMIEDAAHCMPAFARRDASSSWEPCGARADVSCYSFYANKTITTGEGGMAVTDDDELAARMRVMSLHGLSKDAWKRFEKGASWYYEITAPGFKYNLTDIASSLGLHQLARADDLWQERRRQAARYRERLASIGGLALPVEIADRQASWHLFPVRATKGAWKIDRNALIDELKAREITTSVHWMPLHLHPYYRDRYGTARGMFPVAEAAWDELISLPIFPGLRDAEMDEVVAAWTDLANVHGR